MYQVTLENDGRFLPLASKFTFLDSAKVTLARNAIDSFVFTIGPRHDCYKKLFPFTSLVKVIDLSDGSTVFEGRVLDPRPEMDTKGLVSREIVCESVEGYLKDSRMPYLEERQWADTSDATGLQHYIDAVLGYHNAKVEPYKRIYRGEVTFQTYETSGGVFKGFQRETAHDALFKKLVNVFGGEMRVRRDAEGLLRVDYKDRLGEVRGTPITVGRNMRSTSTDFAFSDIVTRLTPLGKKLDDSDDRLTVTSVNDGCEYIDDEELIATYGIIEGTETWDDVEVPANLLTKGREFLKQKGNIAMPVKISALDLSLIGLDPDSIELYDWYPCKNELTGLDATLEVVKKTFDLDDPGSPSLEFGTLSQSQSRAIAKAKQEATAAAASGNQSKPIPISWLESNIDFGR